MQWDLATQTNAPSLLRKATVLQWNVMQITARVQSILVSKGFKLTSYGPVSILSPNKVTDKVITYSGTWLETFGKLGGHGTVNSKRDDEDTKGKYSKFCDSGNFNKDQWDEADLGTELVAQ